MSVIESTATALVRYTGLGIICFNSDMQRGEIAAIRDNKHLLSIKIQRPVYQDDANSDVIVYQDVATYENLPKEDIEIEVSATGNTNVQGYQIYRNGEFDRLDSADVNDFRWIVNMNTLHGETVLNATGGHPYPVTKIFVRNGLFYTHKLDTDLFFEKIEKDSNGVVQQTEVFGNVAETMGVKLEGDEVTFTIRIAGQEESHTLQRVEGLPYRIEIKNMDYNEDVVYSDMADYYGFLSSPDGNQFDLSPIVEETTGEGGDVHNQKQFCHPVASDLPSINQL